MLIFSFHLSIRLYSTTLPFGCQCPIFLLLRLRAYNSAWYPLYCFYYTTKFSMFQCLDGHWLHIFNLINSCLLSGFFTDSFLLSSMSVQPINFRRVPSSIPPPIEWSANRIINSKAFSMFCHKQNVALFSITVSFFNYLFSQEVTLDSPYLTKLNVVNTHLSPIFS